MKQRKSVIALLLVAIIGIVGLTIAYFANSTSVDNTFITKEYGTTYEETFVSPDNWLPGDTTNKTIVATNTGQVDQAVRIHVSEAWTTNNNSTLNGWIHSDGTKSNHTTSEELANDERVAVLNLANTSDWTKVGDYYYYNYKLAPGESTSSFLESVTFNSKTKLDDTCTTSTSNGVKTVTCNSSGDDYDNAIYTLTLTIETVQYNQYNSAWNLNNTVTIAEERPVPKPASEYLAESATNPANTEYNATTKGNMFTFTHGTGANAVTETRYIGDEPKNYVKFNCDDDGTNCETWRILGVFDVDDGTGNVEQRMKLVRGEIIKNDYWNKASNGNGYNDWTADNATLKLFLNGDYYNRTGDAATYGLKASARGMIGDAKYYLGGNNTTSGTTEEIYAWERGTTVCGACNSDTTKLTWTGKVALMYPSDEYMVYGNGVNAKCYSSPSGCSGTNAQTGWVYNSNKLNGSITDTWLLSPGSSYNHSAFCASSIGRLSYGLNVHHGPYGVRPVVYLKSNIKIADGTGEVGSEYTLEEIQ